MRFVPIPQVVASLSNAMVSPHSFHRKKVEVLVTEKTQESSKKAVKWLEENDYERMFLDLPTKAEPFIRRAGFGADYDELLRCMREQGVMKEPEETHLYKAIKPIIRSMPAFQALGIQLYCYRDPIYSASLQKIAVEILTLTLRARLSTIDVKRWKELMREEILLASESAKREGMYVARRAGRLAVCFNASPEAQALLKQEGFEVKETVIEASTLPMDVLRHRVKDEILGGRPISQTETEEIIEDHLKFTDLVLRMDFEEAYKVWKTARRNA